MVLYAVYPKLLDFTPNPVFAARRYRARSRKFAFHRSCRRATGNLDSKTGEEIMALFANLHGQGNTIILVTHETPTALSGNLLRVDRGIRFC
jgi:putative ABC transport system ATP-binding protein